MAIWYVNSAAAGAATGLTKTDAFTTLEAAISAGAAGDTYYLAHTHAQTQASALTITQKGTAASPDRVLSVNFSGSTPPVAEDLTPGAAITTTGASNLIHAGLAYVYGLTFNCGTGASTATLTVANTAPSTMVYEACAFNIVNTASASRIQNGVSGQAELINCTVSFGSVNQAITVSGAALLLWRNKSGSAAVTGATIPTFLLTGLANAGQRVVLDGLDLSNINTTIAAAATRSGAVIMRNCKLHASATTAATPTLTGFNADLINCHSASNVARNERIAYQGTLTTETTIVRTGGASNGVTNFSWKIVTTANNERDFPFETFEGVIWNTSTGSSKTLTIHTVTDNVTLTDAEIWLEVQYLGSGSAPITTLVSDVAATPLTTGANQASSTETWTTTGLTTPVKQKLDVTFTPQMVGLIRWRVKVAKTSTTVYVCPEPTVA